MSNHDFRRLAPSFSPRSADASGAPRTTPRPPPRVCGHAPPPAADREPATSDALTVSAARFSDGARDRRAARSVRPGARPQITTGGAPAEQKRESPAPPLRDDRVPPLTKTRSSSSSRISTPRHEPRRRLAHVPPWRRRADSDGKSVPGGGGAETPRTRTPPRNARTPGRDVVVHRVPIRRRPGGAAKEERIRIRGGGARVVRVVVRVVVGLVRFHLVARDGALAGFVVVASLLLVVVIVLVFSILLGIGVGVGPARPALPPSSFCLFFFVFSGVSPSNWSMSSPYTHSSASSST